VIFFLSNSLTFSINQSYSSFVQNHIAASTEALLYQLLSKKVIFQASGKKSSYLLNQLYLNFSLSVGIQGKAFTEKREFIKYSVTLLILLPFPAVSLQSRVTIILLFVSIVCSAQSERALLYSFKKFSSFLSCANFLCCSREKPVV